MVVEHKYNRCGATFDAPCRLQKHLARKNPCVLITIAPENIVNPHRCLYCNKIFSNRSNLNKHLQTCKIKINANIRTPATDKNMYDEIKKREEEIKKCNEEKDELKKLNDRLITALEQQIKVMQTVANNSCNVTNNITNTINGDVTNNVNITLNDYRRPDISNIVLTAALDNYDTFVEYLINVIYLNKDRPQNHTILATGKVNDPLKIFEDRWKSIPKEQVKDTMDNIFTSLWNMMDNADGGKKRIPKSMHGDDIKEVATKNYKKIAAFTSDANFEDIDMLLMFQKGKDIVNETYEKTKHQINAL